MLNPLHPKLHTKNKQNKESDRQHNRFRSPYRSYFGRVLDSDWCDQVLKHSWPSSSLQFLLVKSPWRFWCGVFVPGWRNRHIGWGHIVPEDPTAQADHGGRGFLALPGLQLVPGFHLYRNQADRLDLEQNKEKFWRKHSQPNQKKTKDGS